MASLRDIKRRIRSVRNTAQITRAMQMVAASRMRRAQQRVLASRPYADAIRTMIGELGQQRADPSVVHPLLEVRPERNRGFVVFTSDRGLAGALNTNVLRAATENLLSSPGEGQIVTVGRKGQDFFARRGRRIAATFTGLGERAEYNDVIPVARVVVDAYTSGAVDSVHIVYPRFVSTLNQRPTAIRLLPLRSLDEHGTALEFIIEPSPEVILEALLPRYIEMILYQTLLETTASEHSARMVSMQNATENARELVGALTLTYNKARQAAITKEISEISSAAEALAKA
ncbi:MAG TPA: ATP synthase F1 subunit gamma [Rhodothermia bacterium]|nr:ATP synthase F1 subunit gamma [Rhodothermia bacterium]